MRTLITDTIAQTELIKLHPTQAQSKLNKFAPPKQFQRLLVVVIASEVKFWGVILLAASHLLAMLHHLLWNWCKFIGCQLAIYLKMLLRSGWLA